MTVSAEDYKVRAASPSEIDALAKGMADAFGADPQIDWLFPDAPREIKEMYFKAQLLWGFDEGVVETADQLEGCAIWLPADSRRPYTTEVALMFLSLTYYRLNVTAEVPMQLPDENTYSLLQFLAAFRTNCGIGTALLMHGVQKLDANGRSAYLEASTPDSCRLYEKLGFSALREFRLPDNGPAKAPMWREPKGRN